MQEQEEVWFQFYPTGLDEPVLFGYKRPVGAPFTDQELRLIVKVIFIYIEKKRKQ